MSAKKYIGIDIGGTNVKIGIVSREGELLEKTKYPTAELLKGKGFIANFSAALKSHLDANKTITAVGIGIPGLLAKDRRSVIRTANIPSLSGVAIIDQLEKAFPKIKFRLENDAKVACLGEYYFSEHDLPENFLMVTLGTGVGGAAIVDGKLFIGGSGNGVEIGHMLGDKDKIYEEYLSKNAMVRYTLNLLENGSYEKSELHKIPADQLTAKDIEAALKKGDKAAKKAYKKFGKWLGRCLVSSMRVLDIHTILLGGGVAKTFKYIQEPMYEAIHEHLGEYYTGDLVIMQASLANEAGIIGAAALNFDAK